MTKEINWRYVTVYSVRPQIPDDFEERIDAVYEREGYNSKAEFVRDAVRKQLNNLATQDIEFSTTAHNGGTFTFGRNPLMDADHQYEQTRNAIIGAGDEAGVDALQAYVCERRRQFPDEQLVIISPDPWYKRITTLDNGTVHTISYDSAANPLHLLPSTSETWKQSKQRTETTEDILQYFRTNTEPRTLEVPALTEKVDRRVSLAEAFFRVFLHHEGINGGDKLSTLREAIRLTYNDRGITVDISTQDKESPTIPDLLDTLYNLSQDPTRITHFDSKPNEADFETEADIIKKHATQLLSDLRAFQDGEKLDLLCEPSAMALDSTTLIRVPDGTHPRTARYMLTASFLDAIERAEHTDTNTHIVCPEGRWLLDEQAFIQTLPSVFKLSGDTNTSFALGYPLSDSEPFPIEGSLETNTALHIYNCTHNLTQLDDGDIDTYLSRPYDGTMLNGCVIVDGDVGASVVTYSDTVRTLLQDDLDTNLASISLYDE